MRRTAYKSISKHLLVFIALTGGLVSCVSEEWQLENPQQFGDALSIVPTVFNGTVTRAETVPAEDALNENLLVSLDVFVTLAGQDAIINQWHLTTPSATIESTVKTLLATQWESTTNIEKNKNYDVYVAANNEATKANITTVTALKALSVTDANIIKKYVAESSMSESTPFTPEKTFVMDGTIKNWTPDNDESEQVFDVDMKRAAAKIEVNVGFSQDFLDMLIYRYNKTKYENDGILEWVDAEGHALAEGDEKVEKPEHEQVHITGIPAWRYVNFSKSAPIFAEGTLDAETEQGKRIFRQNMFFGALNSIDGEDKNFSILTYSYPMEWEQALAINDAPFVMISIRFDSWDNEEEAWVPSYYYYRIPVCDEKTVTSLDRNKIYIVNATIDSFGSAGDNVEQDVTLEYEVMDWRIDDADNSNVIGKPLDFLMVSPLHFNLYGDGTESVTLDAYAPNGKRVLVRDVSVTWVDASGTTRTDKTTGLQTIPTQATNGKITVSSTVLPNHAVKTITFTVYLEGHENDMAHEVTIKHFPVENIQNFAGSWSSRWDGNSSTTTIREYSWNPEADGWESWDGYEDDVECTLEEYNQAVEGKSTTTAIETVSATREDFLANVTTNSERAAANSEANAVNGYWGSNTSHIGYRYAGNSTSTNQGPSYYYSGYNNSNYDYWVREYDYWNGGWYFEYYLYNNYYTKAPVTVYLARRYYRDVITDNPISTGNWVDYELQQGNTISDDNFRAKVFDTSDNEIKFLTAGGGIGNRINPRAYNNHMYVVQISSTSDQYILGKPIMTKGLSNGQYVQSDDNVVSPAFMIASQLGAVSVFTGNNAALNAAIHCKTYLEVGTDGTRYTGWRLPTASEIAVIADRQNDTNYNPDVITEVLGGDYYYNLAGGRSFVKGKDANSRETYVRCVRDLTDDDLKRINGE